MQISPVESIFRPNPPGRDLGLLVPFCRVLLHLIVKTGFMSLKYFLNLHHFSSISRRLSVNARHFLNKHWTFLEKSRTFLQKRGRFSKNVGVFLRYLRRYLYPTYSPSATILHFAKRYCCRRQWFSFKTGLVSLSDNGFCPAEQAHS